MLGFALRLRRASDFGTRRRLTWMYFALVAANLGAWAWAFAAFRGNATLFGSAFLAYGFGLRHAVDADHIAAIDNATRKMMQSGRRPVGVGLYFSLGHSAVVVLLSVAVGLASFGASRHFPALKAVGGIVSTLASTAFLFLLAAFNLAALASIWRAFGALKRGGNPGDVDFDVLLNGRGPLSRIFRPVFGLVSESWHMFPVGFLFGLGFDTATEVALFGISATQALHGASLSTLLAFPALFAAGMSLVDATDGAMMVGAYGWAFAEPARKLYYNLTITAASVAVAVLVAGIEGLGLAASEFSLDGPFWRVVGALNENFGLIGYAIVGVFAACWLASAAIWRLRGYGELDSRGRA